MCFYQGYFKVKKSFYSIRARFSYGSCISSAKAVEVGRKIDLPSNYCCLNLMCLLTASW